MSRVLVTGATGYIGGRLVPELLDAGHDVVCLVRTPAKLEAAAWHESVEAVEGDVADVDAVREAMTGCGTAYFLVHSMGNAGDFADADRANAESFRTAAASVPGLDQIVYLGGLGRLARKHGVRLRQSYARVAKRAAMMAGRYAHAKQFKRHRRELRFLRARLGRLIRDIGRKIEGEPALEEALAQALSRARQIRSQQQRQRGWKLYSFHAPEVECIGKGKAHAPYEFGVKASIVTTNARAPGGQFVLHAAALPGNPYDGHTLGPVVAATERLTGCAIERGYLDKGYRGHNAAKPRRFFLSGQRRGVFGVIKRELRRRSAIEAVIGHMKNEGHLGRCWLKGREGDAANVVLSAIGYNFRLVLAWLRAFLRLILTALLQALGPPSALKSAC
jgi:IS5 family transposase